MVGIIVLVVLVLIVFYVIGVYNSLVSARLNTENAWAQIDTELKRRFDLIPNLVETVKGYAKHEKETLEKVIQARNSYNSANTIEDKVQASNMLTGTLKTLFAVSESYPDLKANENFISLQNTLKETEDKIASSRNYYNDAVEKYNRNLLVFPKNIIASMFKFKEGTFFKASEAERENIKVKF